MPSEKMKTAARHIAGIPHHFFSKFSALIRPGRHLGQCRPQAAVIAQKLAKGVDQQLESDELDAFLRDG